MNAFNSVGKIVLAILCAGALVFGIVKGINAIGELDAQYYADPDDPRG